MIRIESVHIEEFRGIRNLQLDLNCENFGLYGPNGSGKSSIIDAIEFCLTGEITRFSAPGQGNIKIKDHGPHVDSQKTPQKAKVTVTVYLPSINKTATITRSIDQPKSATITPNDRAVLDIVENYKIHTDFALSRRDLAKLVIAQPGQRSSDVQTLLRLGHIEKIRKSLSSYARTCKQELEEVQRNRDRAEQELKVTLSVTKLDRKEVLYLANAQRKILGLSPITKLEAYTNFLESPNQESFKRNSLNVSKDFAISKIDGALRAITRIEDLAFINDVESAIKHLSEFEYEHRRITTANEYNFISLGRELIVKDVCPFCDNHWNVDELRAHINAKLDDAEIGSDLFSKSMKSITSIVITLKEIEKQIRNALEYAIDLEQTHSKLELEQYAHAISIACAEIVSFESDNSKIVEAISALKKAKWRDSSGTQARLVDLKKFVSGLPDDSAKTRAIGFLTELQFHYKRLLVEDENRKRLVSRSESAQSIYNHFCEATKTVLEQIYEDIAKDLTVYYKIINDDEDRFFSELIVDPAKLWFNVGFYERGSFPASAYHSEGHQDCLGLCLYLALMKHIRGDDFTFTMLDDVLMYTDSLHRRAVSKLLKTKFPKTQFIITTHDLNWFNFMKSDGLVGNALSLGDWSIADGPSIIDDRKIWVELENALANNDETRASALMRRYLQQTLMVLAEKFRAKIEFRTCVDYHFEGILEPTIASWRGILKSGIAVATSWGHKDTKARIEAVLEETNSLYVRISEILKKIGGTSYADKWNALTGKDLRELFTALKALLDHIRCDNIRCGGFPYIVPRIDVPEQIRCDCGSISINLKPKSS